MKLIFFITYIFMMSCSGMIHYKNTEREGSPLPEFNLQLSDSSYFSSKNVPTKKKIILFYFSPTCPYCRATLRSILNHLVIFRGSVIYMITSSDFQAIKEFTKEFKLDHVFNMKVGKDYQSYLRNYFSIQGVPYMLIYNTEKKLVAEIPGSISAEDMKFFIKP